MQTLSSSEVKVGKIKLRFGLAYGMVAGLAFAIALWGLDGYILSQHHGLLPWTKFIIGGILSMTACGLAGWLTMRSEKVGLSFLYWIIASRLLGWFALIVPLSLAPSAVGLLRPELRGFLTFTIYSNMDSRVGVAFLWILVACFIVAAIQLPVVEQAVFSTSFGGRFVPFLSCILILGVSGSVADSLNNQPLRNAVVNLDETIQFWLNTRGTVVDPATARAHRLGTLRSIQESIDSNYWLMASGNDELLEQIPVLAGFSQSLANCTTLLGNPLVCESIPTP